MTPRAKAAGPTLFAAAGLERDAPRPLADRLRPQALDEVVGQDHLLGPDGVLTRMLATRSLGSLVFWGPPGTGKTTVARLLAQATDLHFDQISAIFTGVADLKKVFEEARRRRELGQGTLLFVDEIHRFNRAQQDSFLPVMEDGTIVLVGATTENPSFELNAPLLSRARVLVFRSLDAAAIEKLLARAEKIEGKPLPLDEQARETLVGMADGDGRASLTLPKKSGAPRGRAKCSTPPSCRRSCSGARRSTTKRRTAITISSPRCISRCAAPIPTPRSIISAACWMPASRRSTSRAAWCAWRSRISAWPIRRRWSIANAAKDAYDFLGSPEGELAIAQAVLYCATAPKSNAGYAAYGAAMRVAKQAGSLLPPKHILNAPTNLMKDEGYGRGYAYDHDQEEAFSGQNYFPDALPRQQFYDPPERGFEREIRKRLDYWAKLRKERGGKP